MEKKTSPIAKLLEEINHTFVLNNRTVYTKSIRRAGINMGFAFLVENCNVSQRRRLVGVIGKRFLILLYNLVGVFVFCCFMPYKMIVHGARKGGGRSIAKKEVCGGSVFDKTTQRGSISGGGKEGVLGNTSIIMASSGKVELKERREEKRRVGEFSSFSHVCHLLYCSLILLTFLKHLSTILYVSFHDFPAVPRITQTHIRKPNTINLEEKMKLGCSIDA